MLYAIVQDIKFNLGLLLKNRCTGALTHPSLITLLCKLAGVSMSESEEKTPPKIPLLVPKSKKGSTSHDIYVRDDEDKGDAALTTKEEVEDDEIAIELPPRAYISQGLIDDHCLDGEVLQGI